MITVDDLFKKFKYKYIEHTWTKPKNMHKPVCSGCGLLRLRNKATDKAVKDGCLWDLK